MYKSYLSTPISYLVCLFLIVFYLQIRSLEERLRALENERAGISEKKEESVNKTETDAKPSTTGGSAISATKRKLLDAASKLIKPSSR